MLYLKPLQVYPNLVYFFFHIQFPIKIFESYPSYSNMLFKLAVAERRVTYLPGQGEGTVSHPLGRGEGGCTRAYLHTWKGLVRWLMVQRGQTSTHLPNRITDACENITFPRQNYTVHTTKSPLTQLLGGTRVLLGKTFPSCHT